MSYVAIAALCIVFIELFILLGVRQRIDAVFSVSREATQTILSPELTDRQKELAVRQQSLALLKATVSFIALFAVIGGAIYACYQGFVYFFPSQEEALVGYFLSPVVILATTIGAIAYVWLRKVLTKRL